MAKDVHTEHCCLDHGCKYGDDNCTVVSGRREQSFRCEQCECDAKRTEWIEPIVRRFLNFKDPEDCKLGNALIGELKEKAREVL